MSTIRIVLFAVAAGLLPSTSRSQSYRFEVVYEIESNGPYSSLLDPAMNSSGVVAFSVTTPAGPEYAVVRVENGQAQEIVPFSAGYVYTHFPLRVAENGDVLIPAKDELLLWDAASEQLLTVADKASASAVVGSPVLLQFLATDVNASGQVAMAVRPGAGGSERGILTWKDGVLAQIDESFGPFDFLGDVAIDDDGSVYCTPRYAAAPNDRLLVRFPPAGPYQVLDTSPKLEAFSDVQVAQGVVLYLALGDMFIRRYDDLNGVTNLVQYGSAAPNYTSLLWRSLNIGSATEYLFGGTNGQQGPPGLFTGPDPVTDSVMSFGDCITGVVAGDPLLSRDAIDSQGRVVFAFESGVPAAGRHVVLATPEAPPGQSVCEGTASAQAPCPCGNQASGCESGCHNSSGYGGHLVGHGSTSFAADDLVFQGNGLPPGKPGLLFAGTVKLNGNVGLSFGDGLLCAGGITRLALQQASIASGAATWGPGLLAGTPLTAGSNLVFQVWYRDPPSAGPCGSGFNVTNGYELTLTP